MMHLLILAVHLLATIAKLVRPGGVRAVVAESLLVNLVVLTCDIIVLHRASDKLASALQCRMRDHWRRQKTT
jgi:hypothetical protein